MFSSTPKHCFNAFHGCARPTLPSLSFYSSYWQRFHNVADEMWFFHVFSLPLSSTYATIAEFLQPTSHFFYAVIFALDLVP